MTANEGQRRPMKCFFKLFFNVLCIYFIFVTQQPTTANEGQRRSTKANEGPRKVRRRSTKAHSGQRRPTKASAGQRRPTAANDGQRRPTKANEGQRRPTKTKRGPNDASGIVWALGSFFYFISSCYNFTN